MANKRSWDLEHQRKKLAYLFRAYVRHQDHAWHVRNIFLDKLASDCGDHYRWSEMIHVGPTLERQDWAIFGFKEHERKLQFEAGLPAVMAIEIKPVDGIPVRNRLADPDRDSSDAARRRARQARDLR